MLKGTKGAVGRGWETLDARASAADDNEGVTDDDDEDEDDDDDGHKGFGSSWGARQRKSGGSRSNGQGPRNCNPNGFLDVDVEVEGCGGGVEPSTWRMAGNTRAASASA